MVHVHASCLWYMGILRCAGSSMNIMDDVERAIDDGVNVVKTMTREGKSNDEPGSRVGLSRFSGLSSIFLFV